MAPPRRTFWTNGRLTLAVVLAFGALLGGIILYANRQEARATAAGELEHGIPAYYDTLAKQASWRLDGPVTPAPLNGKLLPINVSDDDPGRGRRSSWITLREDRQASRFEEVGTVAVLMEHESRMYWGAGGGITTNVTAVVIDVASHQVVSRRNFTGPPAPQAITNAQSLAYSRTFWGRVTDYLNDLPLR